MSNWLQEHLFEARLGAFLLMTLNSIGLYYAAQTGHSGWIWTLLGLNVVGSLIAIFIK